MQNDEIQNRSRSGGFERFAATTEKHAVVLSAGGNKLGCRHVLDYQASYYRFFSFQNQRLVLTPMPPEDHANCLGKDVLNIGVRYAIC